MRQLRGDVVVEDLVQPQAGDREPAEAEDRSEDGDGGQQQDLANASHSPERSTRI